VCRVLMCAEPGGMRVVNPKMLAIEYGIVSIDALGCQRAQDLPRSLDGRSTRRHLRAVHTSHRFRPAPSSFST
jgi:hypothetical protein